MNWAHPSSDHPVDDKLREAVGGHPLVAEILARRGITDVDAARAFLDPAHYTPTPADALPDVEIAAMRLLDAIRRGERILVWGDFDVDGQTSTTLLVDALRGLGAEVEYHIPLRLEHGHGVQVDVLRGYLQDGIDVVLTCDTGIAAHEAVQAAREAGVTMLITDHHSLPPRLPDAPAIVNPQRLPAGHPLRDLPGVGVAYKLAEKLYALADRAGEERRLLDLVSLGIVADVARQQHDTRYLLQLGLDALRSPRRVGIQALMAAAQIDPTHLSSDTIGFQIGPRLNALGRLGDAARAVELLTTDDRETAQQIAQQLNVLNDQRRQIQDQITAAALAQIEANPQLLNFEALVLAGEHWHPGVIGIVASRLVELYQRPVVMLALEPGQPARGSARSVPGVDIGASIAAHADLLISHGGHPGAAGCALDADLIDQFRRRLANTVADTRDPNASVEQPVDAVVPLGDLSMELAEELNRLAPFGEGNPPVTLMTPALTVKSHTVFGVDRSHRRLTVEDASGNSHVVTWWRGAEHPAPQGIIDLLYIPRINDYKGRQSLELEWVDSRPTPGAAVEKPERRVFDLRRALDPLSRLPDGGFLVWAEALGPGQLPFDADQITSRAEPRMAPALVVWTVPPGPHELKDMIAASGADVFYVAGQHQPDGDTRAFAERLAGLLKHAVHTYPDGVPIPRLAAAMAQREVTVRRGLDWLAAKGLFHFEWLADDLVRCEVGGEEDPAEAARLQDAITALLREASAFRAYFDRADLSQLFKI